jgi:hypothetical protein
LTVIGGVATAIIVSHIEPLIAPPSNSEFKPNQDKPHSPEPYDSPPKVSPGKPAGGRENPAARLAPPVEHEAGSSDNCAVYDALKVCSLGCEPTANKGFLECLVEWQAEAGTTVTVTGAMILANGYRLFNQGPDQVCDMSSGVAERISLYFSLHNTNWRAVHPFQSLRLRLEFRDKYGRLVERTLAVGDGGSI